MSVWKSDEKLLIFASLISPSIKIIRTVTLTVACSVGVFWVGETLFLLQFVILLSSPSLILWQWKIGESTNRSSLRAVSTWRFREQIARPKKTPALQTPLTVEFVSLEKINFWGDKGGVCGWSAGSRGVICDGKRSENFIADRTPLFTVESTSVTNLVKYFPTLGGNERCPKGNEFGKRRFPRGSAL